MSTQNDTAVLDELLDEQGIPEQPDQAEPPIAAAGGGRGARHEAHSDEDDKRRRRFIIWFLLGALVIVGGLFAWYLLTRKPLTDLPGVSTGSTPSYKFSIYDLQQPMGVAVTPDGSRIYVSEGGTANDVKVFDRQGKLLTTLPLPKETSPLPMYIAVDPGTNRVLVTDRSNKQILTFDANHKFTGALKVTGDLGEPAFSPLGIAIDKDHNIYVTDVRGEDAKAHRVVVLDKNGKLLRTMGPGDLNYPNGIVVDAKGLVRVADSNNGRMVTFDKSGKITVTIARGIGEGDLGLPRGMGMDDSGRLFIVDTTDHMVRIYTTADDAAKAPSFVANFGDQGQADGQFEYPNGLATDTRARIYVTDRENSRLQVWGF